MRNKSFYLIHKSQIFYIKYTILIHNLLLIMMIIYYKL